MMRLRACSVMLLSVLALLASGPANALIPITTTEYTFIGDCAVGDCSGEGIGVLTLKDYTLGDAFIDSEFVSFSYSSNLTHFTIDSSDLAGLIGMLPTNLPNQANVEVAAVGRLLFVSQMTGTWCTGANCLPDDGGASSIWRTGGVLEPSTWALMIIGFAGLAYAGYRRSRRAVAAV
jgi:hypothetical protein